MKKRFGILYITNFFGTTNDNFMKTMAGLVAVSWVAQEYQSLVVSVATITLVLPFVLCSSWAGRLTQRYSKKNILRIAKLAELPIVALSMLGFYYENVWMVCSALLLMGIQSSLYSPAKYGLVRDIGGVENVSVGMGAMESINFLAMLAGTVIASFYRESWLMALFAVLGFAGSICLRADEYVEEEKVEKVRLNPFVFLKNTHQMIKEYRGLNSVIITLSVFWWCACLVQMGMFVYCPQILGMDQVHTGLMVTIAGLGIGVGSVFFGKLDKKHDLVQVVPLSALIQALLYLALFFIGDLSCSQTIRVCLFAATLFIVSLSTGIYKVPLDAEIQRMAVGQRLNIILAYFNQISFLFMVLAALMFIGLTAVVSVKFMFVMLSIGIFVAGVYFYMTYRPAACGFSRYFLHQRYDVRITVNGEACDSRKAGERFHERMQPYTDGKGLLVMPNHQAVMDPLIMYSEMYRMQVSPLVEDSYFSTKVSRQLLSLFDAIPVPQLKKDHSRAGIEQAMALEGKTLEALGENRNMLFYPSGHITLDGKEHIGNRGLAYNVCRHLPAEARVMMVRIKGLWGSRWSRAHSKKTPNLPLTLLKSIGLWMIGYCRWTKKRVVTIDFVDMTETVRQWALGTKQEFNANLEGWYNA